MRNWGLSAAAGGAMVLCPVLEGLMTTSGMGVRTLASCHISTLLSLSVTPTSLSAVCCGVVVAEVVSLPSSSSSSSSASQSSRIARVVFPVLLLVGSTYVGRGALEGEFPGSIVEVEVRPG